MPDLAEHPSTILTAYPNPINTFPVILKLSIYISISPDIVSFS